MLTTLAAAEYRALHAELAALIDAGRGESAEADDLRDRMDGPWRRMAEAERAAWPAAAESGPR